MLLVSCVYSHEVWFLMLGKCGWPHLTLVVEYAIASWWLCVRKQVPKARWPAFNSIVLLVVRSI
jgi:hypothetical protein